MNTTQKHVEKMDNELVSIIQDFIFLSTLSWPNDAMRKFLKSEEIGKIKLPKISYEHIDYSDKIKQLTLYLKSLGTENHPALNFLRNTAESYLDAYRILHGAGTKDVTEFSYKLYGGPKDLLNGYKRRNVDVARYFLRVVKDYRLSVEEEPQIYSASDFKQALLKQIKRTIDPQADPIAVLVDSKITARAAAGSNYVKVRKGARFSQSDLDQLFHHEVMIHTLTYINGRKQPLLKTLGYNAPRTTATQEGLAVFAEYINNSIDLTRLKRIALRIVALDLAEDGADFIDLFRFYQKHGQTNEESYYSAMRIFRGGDPKGGIVFYKDNVYLRGLIEIEAFFKRTMHNGMIHDIDLLFCGKLTIEDIADLNTLSTAGQVIDPAYMPHWATRSSELAAHLAFNDLTERFKIK